MDVALKSLYGISLFFEMVQGLLIDTHAGKNPGCRLTSHACNYSSIAYRRTFLIWEKRGAPTPAL